jgi:hypothetical protein
MLLTTTSFRVARALLAAVALAAGAGAQAVPSFARQTGQDCAACHVGAFGPQLTPYGIRFKLGGYTETDGQDGKVPLSAMAVAGTSRYRDGDKGRVDASALAEASAFFAGRVSEHIGGFVQATYDGLARHVSIDQADLRFAREARWGGHDAVLGLSMNNNPSVQDPFNTLPVWRFPFVGSPYGNDVGAPFLGFGNAETKVGGLSGYALVDDSLYAEAGLYQNLSARLQHRLGISPDDTQAYGRLRSAPYLRLAYTRDLRTSAWSVGAFGFDGTLSDRDSRALIGRYRSRGLDASYQYLGTRRHVFAVNASLLRERQTQPSPDDPSARIGNTLTEAALMGSYHYQGTYGVSLGTFDARAADRQSGNRGTIWQADWTPFGKESSWGAPWANLRLGAQEVIYTRYIEEGTALDRPSDRNTLYLFAWTSI